MSNNHCEVQETVDPESQIPKAMDDEDSEPRIARIRENLVDGLGPFDVMADIIVGSQHGPNNSGLFGVVQSPIRPLRPCFVPSSSIASVSESHLTATQMAQNEERKNNSVRGSEAVIPSASFMNTGLDSSRSSTTSSRADHSSCRKRKRRRSDCINAENTENWQKPCTSSITAKMECDDNRMTISELFGEEKLENGNTKKRPIDMLKNMEKKMVKWEKEEQESPDSGFADEVNDQNREQFHRPRLQTIIGELGYISPLLTPPRQPQKSDGPTLPVIINLNRLDSAQLLRIKNVFITNAPAFLSTVALPSCVLSPPVRPASRNERDRTSQLCDSDLKPVPKIDNSGSSVNNHKKQITHSAGATPSSSSTKDFRKKFIEQCDKTCITASLTSSIKENEKRNKKDCSAPPGSGEQLPSTSKLGKKSSQLMTVSLVPSGKSDELMKGKKKGCLDSEYSKEKEKSATFRVKECNVPSDEPDDGNAITQLRELKKKANDATISITGNNNTQVGNMRSQVAKSLTCKDNEAPSARKCKKDTCAGNKSADGMREVGDFVCCRSYTAPTKKTVLEKNDDGSYKCANYYLDEVARPLKHKADKESCMSNFGALTKWEPQLTELDAAAMRNDGAASISSHSGSSGNTETPSPASSTNSGHGERQKEINVPVSIYQAQRSQLSILHHLMWSDRLWKQTSTKMNGSEQEMVKHLDQTCGPLTVDLSLYSLSEYLATAITWLRAEYRAEKERLSRSSL